MSNNLPSRVIYLALLDDLLLTGPWPVAATV